MPPSRRQAPELVEAARRRRELAPRGRERLELVKGVALGWSLAPIARWSGRDERTVGRWLVAFATDGVAALADAPRSGRPARAAGAYLAALERAVDPPPRALGRLFDAWTSERLSAYLAETTGVRIAPGWVRALRARQRYRPGRPQHPLGHRQAAPAQAAGAPALQAVGEQGAGGRRGVRGARPG